MKKDGWQDDTLEQEIYNLRQKNRKLKKLLSKLAPKFQKQIDHGNNTMIIYALDWSTAEYQPYIFFRLNSEGFNDDITHKIVDEVLEKLFDYYKEEDEDE